MSWTQPICDDHWHQRYPDRTASVVVDAPLEHCCICGRPTKSGIYVRIDPATVQYPKRDEDDG